MKKRTCIGEALFDAVALIARTILRLDGHHCINTTLPHRQLCLPRASSTVCHCFQWTEIIILLNLTRTRSYLAQPLCRTQIFWNALIDMAMTPCGLRPFEPQCLWYDVSNWLLSVPCVTGIPNGRQAHHRLCYRPPYTQSLLTTPSIMRVALRMASGKRKHAVTSSFSLSHSHPTNG